MLNFSEQNLVKRFEALSIREIAAFAASCSERISMAYSGYIGNLAESQAENVIRNALDYVWNYARTGNRDRSKESSLLHRCENELIDEDEAWGSGYPYAEDATAAAVMCLRLVQTENVDQAVYVARRLYECADNYAVRQIDIDFDNQRIEDEAITHSVVQEELTRQNRDLDELLKNNLSDSLIDRLRDRSVHEGRLGWAATKQSLDG